MVSAPNGPVMFKPSAVAASIAGRMMSIFLVIRDEVVEVGFQVRIADMMNSETLAPRRSVVTLDARPSNAQVANTRVRSIGPPAVKMRTMSKLAKVTISENSAVIAMMLRIIGSVTYHMRLPPVGAVDGRGLDSSCSGTDFSAARYMIIKNGAPIQTFTKMTENRAQ